MEVSRHCEEMQYNESREQMEARKQKRRELQEKFAKERKERRREKERIKMEEGRGRRFEKMMKKKKSGEKMKVPQIRKKEVRKEKWKDREKNIKKWEMLQQGDSSVVQEDGETIEESQGEVRDVEIECAEIST